MLPWLSKLERKTILQLQRRRRIWFQIFKFPDPFTDVHCTQANCCQSEAFMSSPDPAGFQKRAWHKTRNFHDGLMYPQMICTRLSCLFRSRRGIVSASWKRCCFLYKCSAASLYLKFPPLVQFCEWKMEEDWVRQVLVSGWSRMSLKTMFWCLSFVVLGRVAGQGKWIGIFFYGGETKGFRFHGLLWIDARTIPQLLVRDFVKIAMV